MHTIVYKSKLLHVCMWISCGLFLFSRYDKYHVGSLPKGHGLSRGTSIEWLMDHFFVQFPQPLNPINLNESHKCMRLIQLENSLQYSNIINAPWCIITSMHSIDWLTASFIYEHEVGHRWLSHRDMTMRPCNCDWFVGNISRDQHMTTYSLYEHITRFAMYFTKEIIRNTFCLRKTLMWLGPIDFHLTGQPQ